MVPLLNGEKEGPIQAEGALVGAGEVGACQRVTFQDPMVVAVEEATLFFLEALGMVLRAGVHIDKVAWVVPGAWAFLESFVFLELLVFLELPKAYCQPS